MDAPQVAVALARQVPLARVPYPVAGAGEPGEQRGLTDEPVVEHAVEVSDVGKLQVVVRVAPRQQRGARRRAQRDRREGVGEAHPRGAHGVHGGRPAHRRPVAAQRIEAELVGEQYQDVRLGRHRWGH